MNLLGIEFTTLIIGIGIVVWTLLNLFGVYLKIQSRISDKLNWKYNFNIHFIMSMIGIILIIISQNI